MTRKIEQNRHGHSRGLQDQSADTPSEVQNLHLLIEQQAARTPGLEAVRFNGQSLTYAELEQRANQCAHYLRELGVGPDTIVGVLMDRSLELVVALLAVLKAGGAYLPLDVDHPPARLQFLLHDASVPVVLSQQRHVERLTFFSGTVLPLDTQAVYLQAYACTAPEPVNQSRDLAYVIYTSGSTGQPKGCLLPHGAICNRLTWMQDEYRIGPGDRVLQKTPYTFDVSVWEFFWPLLTGATVVLAAPQGHKDSHYMVKLIRAERITVCHFVPSMLRFFLADEQAFACQSLRHVFVSGEALPFELLEKFTQTLPASLHNLYGPTEAAVDVSYWACEVRSDRKVPIGRAIRNVRLYVLDEGWRPVQPGTEGELYIAGACLARGYLGQPRLTAQAFVDDPFFPGEKMYRTGDRAVELDDGTIEFMGRVDFQVKLRGLRVELGEIETRLRQYEGIRDAVVVVRGEEEGDPKLVAYLDAAPSFSATSKQVRQFLALHLPEYMVPNQVVPLEKWPVTVHGKLDRSALPWPVSTGMQEPGKIDAVPVAVGPGLQEPVDSGQSALPAILARIGAIAADMLKHKELDAQADLFDMGATSLTLVRIVEQIRKEFEVAVPLDVFLDEPTVDSVARYVAQAGGQAVEQADAQAVLPPTGNDVGIPLPPVRYRSQAYLAPQAGFSGAAVPAAALGACLGLLMAGTTSDGQHKYRYPSGGGLNAVRTYVYVRDGGVSGVKGGAYYYHPIEHALYAVGADGDYAGSAFGHESSLFAQAAFAVFFIVELDAIEPLYKQVSGPLAALEAGYMSQLLSTGEHGLQLMPAVHFDPAPWASALDLSASERFVHCVFAGAPAASAVQGPDYSLEQSAFSGALCVRHDGSETVFTTAPEGMVSSEQLHAEHRQLRRFPDVAVALALPRIEFAWAQHHVRASCRDYLAQTPDLAQLGRLLGMARAVSEHGQTRRLYAGSGLALELDIYIYLRDGVAAQGLYRYDATQHQLAFVHALTAAQLEQAYTPYNRKHFKKGSFCLFVLGRCAHGEQRQAGLHAGLIEAGHLGQLFLERQGGVGLGFCPIGAIRFERIQQAFGLPASMELLHSFIGGAAQRELPPDRVRIEVPVPAVLDEVLEPAPFLPGEPVAIVGISGRYPDADSIGDFWRNLLAGVSSIGAVPEGRSAQDCPSGAYLQDIASFDSLLFGISPLEARALDPQERLLLEQVWAGLEDAGCTAQALKEQGRRVGVFVGAMWNDYQSVGLDDWRINGQVRESSHHASLANRISHVFDFAGPSLAVNTSCASGLTALHLASESLRRGECDVAIVGAVNLLAHAYHGQLLRDMGLLSDDGAARPLSAQASGWAPGEGVGVVILKSQRLAQNDGDRIHALIRATYIGHSGRASRYCAPNVRQQTEHLSRFLAQAQLQASDISYIEAAAPGASLADAAEMSAINQVFGKARRAEPCRIGTIKANIGHLESASGLSQLTKVVLQLAHNQLAPSLNTEPRNPLIGLDAQTLTVVTEALPWSAPGPRHALINSIGAAGSCGYLIVTDCPAAIEPPRAPATPQLILLSALTREQLHRHIERLRDFVRGHADTRLDDLAFTLQAGRVFLPERLAFVANDLSALEHTLDAVLAGQALPQGVYRGQVPQGQALPDDEPGRDLDQVAQAWVRGVRGDRLPERAGRRILSLPSYPFERVAHWLDDAPWDSMADIQTVHQVGASAGSPAKDRVLDNLRTGAQRFLVEKLAQASGTPASRIGTDQPLEALGLNSLIIQLMNSALEPHFPGLPKTVFFEHRTLDSLADYLVQTQRQNLAALLGMSDQVDARVPLPALRTHASRSKMPGRGDIAIVGLAGRYPQAETLEQFWENLAQGRDSIQEVPRERWDTQGLIAAGVAERISKWGGFLQDVDAFDPLFFNISPLEAERMDPQERLMLQTAWETLEDAGYGRKELEEAFDAQVGVFIGVMYSEYPLLAGLEQGLGITGSYGSIANRVSYALNLRGPSMAIDTMCSSSLTALHLACESIRSGDSLCAIAGGVNLSLHPNKYVTHALLNMPASTGRCQSFGAGGDGFVPGEGVGAVLLKPIERAIADGDHIYGVIKASSVNHGGKTNGYTVPNPQAQQELIAKALQRGGIDPRTVSYIEAHGTGTALGDPIEIAGLSRAFDQSGDAGSFCAIGSVKSNIGHAESAAGIAGLTKVLLQIKHGQLVPSLHAQELNPAIDFSATPFFVQQTLGDWPRPVIKQGGVERVYPRIAGISSFGAGGSNAHVIVQEYSPPERAEPAVQAAQAAVAVLLSAKNPQRLRARAEQLLGAIERGAVRDDNLLRTAYTLQCGREPMESRLGMVVSTVDALREALQQSLQAQDLNPGDIHGVYRGDTKKYRDVLGVLTAEDLAALRMGWIAQNQFEKLLALWVKGLEVDWRELYGQVLPQRLSLPTYPFARERYWLPVSAPVLAGAQAQVLHPLLHQNTSDFNEQRYTTTLTGQEFFLADHRIQERKVLPGVAYLEMARAALWQASGPVSALQFSQVLWSRPMWVDEQDVLVNIGLYPQDQDVVHYEVYAGPDRVSHGQGVMQALAGQAPEHADLAALRARCDAPSWTAEQCYDLFAQKGLQYGPAHRALESLHRGSGLVLARLRMPSEVQHSADAYVLHPSLMDGALQSVTGLLLDTPQVPARPFLPFAIDQVQVWGPVGMHMWAIAAFSPGSSAQGPVLKFDIDLCADDGQVCVRIQGFTVRMLESPAPDEIGTGSDVLLLRPQWQPCTELSADLSPSFDEHLVLLCDPSVDAELLSQSLGVACEAVPGLYEQQAQHLLTRLQTLLVDKNKGPVLVQVVTPVFGAGQVAAGLAGLLNSAGQEHPRLLTQLIAIEQETPAQLADKLRHSGRQIHVRHQRYTDGGCQALGWSELAHQAASVPWRDEGVYLITGGLGGLGRIWAQEIARTVRGAVLVLTGRRAPDDAARQFMRTLETHGATVQYVELDVSDAQAVRQRVLQVQEEHAGLHGVIHSAGILNDSLLMNKTGQSLQGVLAPKVSGLINLDEATRDVELDCLVAFSSIVAMHGNLGQADYAAANAFMDVYAVYRNSLAALGQRHGRMLSINWPLWKDGGMQIGAAAEQALRKNMGLVPLQTADGIHALYQAWGSGLDQVAVVVGDAARLKSALTRREPAPEPVRLIEPVSASPDEALPADADLAELAGRYLCGLLAQTLHLPPDSVDVETPLEEYGIDSIVVTGMTRELENVFGSLSKTLFFEYQTLQALAAYFVEQHADRLAAVVGDAPVATPTAQAGLSPAGPAYAVPVSVAGRADGRTDRRSRLQAVSAPAQQAGDAAPAERQTQDIAVIGLAGRYPQAPDLDAFWANLSQGVDSIVEVPPERWDHGRYFDPDKSKLDKTYTKWGGFIDGVDEFDPLFFNISPRDAELIDPQERVFLQCAYGALEDAGYTRESLAGLQRDGLPGNVGVYVGVMYSEYQLFAAQQQLAGNPITVMSSPSSIANRVSYFLNLHGPSLAVDTMCSSSLTALHLACEALHRRDCDMAIAGGVNLSVHPNKYFMLAHGKYASSKGLCESFGKGGDGYVPAEGVGAVILKPLSRAQADGDHIYGIIKSTAVNHGGKTNGYTVPNPLAQAGMIDRAIKSAGVDPRTISCVEAHGTGTSLGDPIEITGLVKAFGEVGQDRQFCSIGSVKSNIGHTESTAGIAGLTKLLLQIKHGQLVPSLHAAELNPNIDFEQTPFVVQQQLQEWKRPTLTVNGRQREYPRIAALSSFGAGGSNAHAIVQEPPQPQAGAVAAPIGRTAIFVLSAKGRDRLLDRVRQLLDFIERRAVPESALLDVAYTLQVGREALEDRVALTAASFEELATKLQAVLDGQADGDLFVQGQSRRRRDEAESATPSELSPDRMLRAAQQEQYQSVLQDWANGATCDWESLYQEGYRPRRLSLPTYPFAREKYWLPVPSADWRDGAQAASSLPGAGGRFDQAFFEQLFKAVDEDALSVEHALAEVHKKNLVG